MPQMIVLIEVPDSPEATAALESAREGVIRIAAEVVHGRLWSATGDGNVDVVASSCVIADPGPHDQDSTSRLSADVRSALARWDAGPEHRQDYLALRVAAAAIAADHAAQRSPMFGKALPGLPVDSTAPADR